MRYFLGLFCVILSAVSLPGAVGQPCSIVDFGARGDGSTLDDVALAAASASCSSITFPEGRYLLSPFNISSNMELVLEEGSVLLASTLDILGWPLVQSYPSYEPGVPTVQNRLAPFIGSFNTTNVTIRGQGTIDGQGAAWWDAEANGTTLLYGRPRLVEPSFCQLFAMRGVTVKDPPFWAVHPYVCTGVLLEDLVFSAPLDSPNTDGIDPDSCSDVVIRNFTCLSGGDDAIAIKSGRDSWGRAFGVPSRDILVEGGTIGPSRGVNIGSEMSGGVLNVTVRGVAFRGSEFAVRIKAARGRGGAVEGVLVENCTVDGVTEAAFAVNMAYGSSAGPAPPRAATTPHVRGLALSGVSGTALGLAGYFRCLAEAPCRGFSVRDVNLTLTRVRSSEPGHGWVCDRAFGTLASAVAPDASCLESHGL